MERDPFSLLPVPHTVALPSVVIDAAAVVPFEAVTESALPLDAPELPAPAV